MYKIFIKGLPPETSNLTLQQDLILTGAKVDFVNVVKDRVTGHCRGFAFAGIDVAPFIVKSYMPHLDVQKFKEDRSKT